MPSEIKSRVELEQTSRNLLADVNEGGKYYRIEAELRFFLFQDGTYFDRVKVFLYPYQGNTKIMIYTSPT